MLECLVGFFNIRLYFHISEGTRHNPLTHRSVFNFSRFHIHKSKVGHITLSRLSMRTLVSMHITLSAPEDAEMLTTVASAAQYALLSVGVNE